MIGDPWLWVAGFVLLAYTVEAATGFGSIVISLSLGALLLPVEELLPVLVPLNVLMTSVLVLRHRRLVDRPLLLRRVLPLMLLGTVAGHLARPHVPGEVLRVLLGALVLWFAGRELWRTVRRAAARRHGRWTSASLVAGAGLSHGLVASGGPLLVLALAGSPLSKGAMRASLLAVWLTLNGTLTVLYAVDGTLAAQLPRVLALAPVLLAGVLCGELLHRRLDERAFRTLVHALLAGTAVALLAG